MEKNLSTVFEELAKLEESIIELENDENRVTWLETGSEWLRRIEAFEFQLRERMKHVEFVSDSIQKTQTVALPILRKMERDLEVLQMNHKQMHMTVYDRFRNRLNSIEAELKELKSK